MLSKIGEWDLYRKIPKDLTDSTKHGAFLSLGAILMMVLVFFAEFWAFVSVNYVTDTILDPNNDERMRITFNISVLDLPCEFTSIDVVDVLGTRKEDVQVNINKWAIDVYGEKTGYIGRNGEVDRELAHDRHHDMDTLEKNGIHAVHIDADNFEQFLQNNKYVFVNWYAPWCIWCQRLEPVWEALAQSARGDGLPVSVVKVDCVKNHDFCINHRVQAFPTLRFYTGGEDHMVPYMRERTVVGFTSFIKQQLERDHYVASIEDPAKRALAREETLAPGKAHHGCLLVGYLNVNRVPGNFHVLARSANHNMNPAMANLSHVVNHLQFGGLITKQVQRVMNRVPEDIFAGESALSPMDGNAYGTPGGLHKAYHHYLKLVSTHFNKGVYRGSRAIMVYQMLASDQVMNYDKDEVPEARFSFDLSPMAVVISKKNMKLYQFITHVCALIGGTYTVGMLMSGVLGMLFKAKKI